MTRLSEVYTVPRGWFRADAQLHVPVELTDLLQESCFLERLSASSQWFCGQSHGLWHPDKCLVVYRLPQLCMKCWSTYAFVGLKVEYPADSVPQPEPQCQL